MVRHNYYNSPPPYTAPRGEYANYYRRSQFGAGQLPAFGGTRRQRGHGLFGNLIKTALPMIKNLGMSAVLREIIVNLIILCGPSPTCHLVSISITKCVTFFCTSYNSVVNTSPPSCLNLTESLFLAFYLCLI